jgi:hypothetical protein
VTVIVNQRADEASRTADNSCAYDAETEIGGVVYKARSRRGAPNELARQLVSAGIADQPVIVRTFGLTGEIAYRSLHGMAAWSYSEGRTTRLQRARWSDPTERFGAALDHPGEADLVGVAAADASLHPPRRNTPVLELTP